MDPRSCRTRRRSLLILAIGSVLVLATLLGSADFGSAGSVKYISGSACSGSSTPRWQSGDTWIMYGNVTVPSGCTLTIEPGAFIQADPAVRLYIDGQLLANGTLASYISFNVNRTNLFWGGIQFNGTSRGSYLQYATIRTVDRGVRAVGNPLFAGPTIQWDVIDHAAVGVEFDKSYGYLYWTRINSTGVGVRAVNGGSPSIVANTITTVLGNPAFGIFVSNLDSPTIQSNTIRWVNGSNGANGGSPGGRGRDGGFAVGILVNGTSSATVAGNTVDQVLGGRGGNGAANIGGNGGNGGSGGPAAAIVFGNTPYSRGQTNRITNLAGGHGGNGGASSGLGFSGGAGGAGGVSVAVEGLTATTFGWLFYNTVTGVIGGSAGDGGSGALGAATGRGGAGADAYGFLVSHFRDANVSNNVVQTLRGGYGGNGSAGGAGGQASGLSLFGLDGKTILGSNTVSGLTGGVGGGGNQPVGPGGNVTGIFALGDTGYYNQTTITDTQITALTGGLGGVGALGGSGGGSVTGIAGLLVQLTSARNQVQILTGGQGGSTGPGRPVGRGGPATAMVAVYTPKVTSSLDRIDSILPGAQGTGGNPASPNYGVGLYALGTGSATPVSLLVNDTLTAVNDADLFLDNYTETTTLNSTFSSSKLVITAAANLTVQNFLAVRAYWPNNVTPVSGVRATVLDNGKAVFNRTLLTGAAQWIVVTNRVYVNSLRPTWNATQASVAYLSDTFASNPRKVNMTVSQTQFFTMIDTAPPSSSASALPTWTPTQTFTVRYTYSDGLGVGAANLTLWYRLNGGVWFAYGTQNVSGGSGSFSFTGATDGTYEFATTAIDKAGNAQAPVPPTANNTWTIVDTVRPDSQVTSLPGYETSASFLVSWGPSPGVTDIASYTIQYNAGAGWQTWLANTTLTSATFTASPASGVYAFRSIAQDFAGNTEIAPAGNDTWTIVDVTPPWSVVVGLPAYEPSLTFSVFWQPQFDTFDIASYRVQVNDNNTGWTTWVLSTSATSMTFTGVDGHTYQFRSIATDRAGNVESTPAGNDTWTVVDVTPPRSLVTPLQPYYTSLTFALAWSPLAGTFDVATFTIEVSDNGGPWTVLPGYAGTTATTATYAGQDAHRYAFRSLAKDFAGNVESKGTANDTWTIVDVTRPAIGPGSPRGADTPTASEISVTFSEPMNRASAEAAFSINPDVSGTATWNSDGTVMTFRPDRPFAPGTTYFVSIDSSAKDLAGNTAVGQYGFSFTTAATNPAGSVFGDFWWAFLLIAAAVGGALFFVLRRRSAETKAPGSSALPAAAKDREAIIEDVFLLYHRDGILIKHETRRLRPDVDTDILSGMLTAVQAFVKDALRGDDYAELNEMTVGQMHILIGRGKWLVLAARIEGDATESWTGQIERCIKDMEDHHWDQLEDWDGDMALARVLTPYVKKLIQGGYGPIEQILQH